MLYSLLKTYVIFLLFLWRRMILPTFCYLDFSFFRKAFLCHCKIIFLYYFNSVLGVPCWSKMFLRSYFTLLESLAWSGNSTWEVRKHQKKTRDVDRFSHWTLFPGSSYHPSQFGKLDESYNNKYLQGFKLYIFFLKNLRCNTNRCVVRLLSSLALICFFLEKNECFKTRINPIYLFISDKCK